MVAPNPYAPRWQGNSPYYQPWANQGYGSRYQGPGNFLGTDFGKFFEWDNPQAIFDVMTGGRALTNSPFSNYLRSQQGNIMRGYAAAQAHNPELALSQYLPGALKGMRRGWAQQPWQVTGENPRAWGSNAMRWIL